jgi:hypothetical protein
VDDADGDLDSGGDGADGFAALAAGEDGGAFVVVDDRPAPAGPATFAGGFQPILNVTGRSIAAQARIPDRVDPC